MCSTPKGKKVQRTYRTGNTGLVTEMSSNDYSKMIQRANAAYEQRQQVLAERAAIKSEQHVSDKISSGSKTNKLATPVSLSNWHQYLREMLRKILGNISYN